MKFDKRFIPLILGVLVLALGAIFAVVVYLSPDLSNRFFGIKADIVEVNTTKVCIDAADSITDNQWSVLADDLYNNISVVKSTLINYQEDVLVNSTIQFTLDKDIYLGDFVWNIYGQKYNLAKYPEYDDSKWEEVNFIVNYDCTTKTITITESGKSQLDYGTIYLFTFFNPDELNEYIGSWYGIKEYQLGFVTQYDPAMDTPISEPVKIENVNKEVPKDCTVEEPKAVEQATERKEEIKQEESKASTTNTTTQTQQPSDTTTKTTTKTSAQTNKTTTTQSVSSPAPATSEVAASATQTEVKQETTSSTNQAAVAQDSIQDKEQGFFQYLWSKISGFFSKVFSVFK
ncbi:MAG: hypothetical protein ACD_58C00296G0004 [uncultured bacterium]|nr:MAG: hypothetical protein ACD_58C00296G0004 [uncultured bacterium]